MKKAKQKSIRQLIKKLDMVFSIHVRMKYADPSGMVSCFTCDKRIHWKSAQNSHYASRRHMSTRFEERNCHPACMPCNVFLHGNMDVYALRLQEKYGDGILKELNRQKNTLKKWTAKELQELIDRYAA